MKHLSDYAANLRIADQVRAQELQREALLQAQPQLMQQRLLNASPLRSQSRKATPTWSALKEPHHYVPLRQHTLEGFAERQQQRRRAAGWPEPKGSSHA